MSTGTPTSSLPGATLPPGWPDVVTLARLASEIFNTPPAGDAAVSVPLTNVPASAQNQVGLVTRAVSLVPDSQTATGLPDMAGTAVPPATGRASGPLLGVPEAYAAALPIATGPSGSDAGTFAPAPLAARSATGLPERAGAVDLPVTGGVSGPLLGVPEDYAPALPTVTGLSGAHAGPAAKAEPATPFYYFLDEAAAAPFGAPAAADRSDPLAESVPGDDAAPGVPGAAAQPSLQSVPESKAPAPSTPYYFLGESSAYRGFYFAEPPATAKSADGGASVPRAGTDAHPPFDVDAVRRDFPILAERVNGRPLAWLDNAATTQKPRAVIERLSYFYQHENSNIHRAAHELAARATDAYEAARSKVARFLGASSPEEIIFVRGTTEAINLVAQSWARQNLSEGDEIVLSHLEHHANIVPWQQVASEKGAKIRVIPVDDSGQVLLEQYRRLLNDRTRIVAVSQVSNALGTIVPVKQIVDLAHRAGARALVDGAQSVAHMRVDVQALDADFFVFSGHKIFGPTGIGVVYGKRELLEQMPPWQGGGNMISDVTFERTLYAAPPARFEAGTGNIADAVGLGAALDYLERIGLENVGRYEHDLLEYGMQALRTVPGLRLIGTAKEKASVMSFVLEGRSVEEVGKALNQEGIAVRAGHHCAQPILRRFGVEATVRPSLAFYNTCEEIDRLIAVLYRLTGSRGSRPPSS
jgi:cysteine desulfurase / selenocysteine lyase